MTIERLVDEHQRAKVASPATALEWQFIQAEGIQSAVATLSFERQRPGEHYVLAVSLAPAGHFWGPARHDPEEDPPPDTGVGPPREIPGLGLRARREFFGMGPGGSGHGLTFTTQDGRHDVRIAVSELLPENVTGPEVDLEAFARRIAARYDAQSPGSDPP